MIQSPGGPLTDHEVSIPSIWASWTSGRMRWTEPRAAPAPEYSLSGATTVTSPRSFNERANSWSPKESMPSSLVTKIRIETTVARRNE